MRLGSRLLAAAVSVLMAASAAVLSIGSAAHAASLDFWTVPAATSVFRESTRPPAADAAVRLDVARNEYEAAQIVIRSSDAFTISGVTLTALTSGVNSIAASNLSYNFVTYEYLDRNSVFGGTQRVYAPTRIAPGYFPDGLSNERTMSVAANTTQSIWIRLYVPATAAAGIYSGSVGVQTSVGSVQVPISADVRAVTLPDSNESSFTSVQWHLFFGDLSWQEAPQETINRYYGHTKYSPGWWQLMANWAEEMRKHRSNNLTVPIVRALLDGGSRMDANGQYSFNWTRYDEIVKFFLDRRVVRRLEGFWMNGGPNYHTKWDVEIMTRNAAGNTVRAYVPWDSAAANNFMNQFIPALRDHISRNGWEAMWWMHVGDEPQGDHGEQAWTEIARVIRNHWPQVKLGDAAFHEPWASRLAARADIVIPNLLNYDHSPQAYDQARAAGKELWFYNCNIPTLDYLNRFIDQPHWHQRMTMWFAYTRGATGYLHWAFNNWPLTMDQQEVKGDGYIVRPDPARNTIEVSTRYEALRDGIEDWEVLTKLGQTRPDLAKQLARALVQTPAKYTQDVEHMAAIRRLLLDAAAGLSVPANDLARGRPASASSSNGGGPINAVDGNPTTVWAPARGDTLQWLQVDLGGQAQVDGVRLQWAGPHATRYKIQISYDGTLWTDEESFSRLEETAGNGGEDFIGVNGRGRYIRIAATASSGGSTAYRLASLEVAGRMLSTSNVLGGRTYTKSVQPLTNHPDYTGRESSDGVTSTGWDDRRGYGYSGAAGTRVTVAATFDLGTIRELSRARAHPYGPYHWYRPDTLTVSISVDGVNWSVRGTTGRPTDQSGLWYDFAFSPAGARYVRFTYVKTYGTGDTASLFLDEMEAYSAPDGGMPSCFRVQERPLPDNALLRLWACPSPRPGEYWFHGQLVASAPGQLGAGDSVSVYYHPYSRGIVSGSTVTYSGSNDIRTPNYYAGFQEVQACAVLRGTFYCAWY